MPEPANITKIPASRVPVTDPQTGLVSRDWYRFFFNLFNLTGAGNNPVSLDDLQVGPSNDQNASLAALEDQVQGLALAPPPREYRVPRYGSFYDTTTQTAAAINTAYAMRFNTTDLSLGVTVGAPTSRIYVDRPNIYNIQFSAQLDKTSGGVGLIWIWLSKNGVDVPYSATQIRVQGNNAETVAAWNFLLQMNAGDYFELKWAVDDISVQIQAFASAAPVPAIPSIILTVTDNVSSLEV